MNSRLDVFSKSLDTCGENGIAEYKDCILTHALTNCMRISESAHGSIQRRLQTMFANIFGLSDANVKTYVLKKSLLCDQNESSHFQDFGVLKLDDVGRAPLELDDKLANISLGVSEPLSANSFVLEDGFLISEDRLREIVSYLHLLLNKHGKQPLSFDSAKTLKNLLPMLIFCKWEYQQPDPNGVFYVTLQLGPGGEVIGLVEQRVALSGPYNSSKWVKEPATDSSPSHGSHETHVLGQFHSKCIENLIKQHLRGTHPSCRPSVSLKSYGEFEPFLSSRTILSDTGDDVNLSVVMLGVTCNKAGKILSAEKQHVKEVMLNVTPVPGDMRSSAFYLYKSIQILEGFFSAFGEHGDVKWTCPEGDASKESSKQDPKVPIVVKIKQVISAYNSEWMVVHKRRTTENQGKVPTKDRNESVSVEEATSRQMMSPREELDFTEKLWEILQYAGSCEDLATSFGVIFKEVSEGRSTQFWLHRDNNTTLARMIRESYKGEVSCLPKLTDATCIQLLIELGLDKLARDYNTFFLSNRLTNASRLQPYLGGGQEHRPSSGPKEAVSNLQKRFILLKKLHQIVELVIQCKVFVCLSSEQTFSITRAALQSYISEDLDFKKTFSFAIDYSGIERLVKNTLPSIWRLTLSSEMKNHQKVTNVCWNTQYPFHGVISSPALEVDESLNVRRGASISSLHNDVTPKYYVSTQSTSIFTF